MSTNIPGTGPFGGESALDPKRAPMAPAVVWPEANPGNPGEPTPGSDNDGPEEGYTRPEDLAPRPIPGISLGPGPE
jgi:hypothetical protein